ncbi:hypothetical protein M9H77_31029 [Catharanthus roseus]|uniref:Uncharacterized protein n=1 Tax=Catharanthus roseus TaxID=4058 RepID=A0ACC0A082_CATRO|nr:hypothetical protein M9H77_31029 [Catharanthus roseus]
MKKLKASNGNDANGIVAYMGEALKNKFEEFEDQGKASKLFTICSICKDHSREQFDGFKGYFKPLRYRFARFLIGFLLECLNLKILNRGSSREGGDLWEGVESKLHSKWIYIKVLSEQPPIKSFIMSTEGPLPTQSHQEGTSDPTRMNLNETLRFIPQARGRRKGGQGGRGYYRLYEEVPRHEAWREDNLFDNFGEDPNVGQSASQRLAFFSKSVSGLVVDWIKLPIIKRERDKVCLGIGIYRGKRIDIGAI